LFRSKERNKQKAVDNPNFVPKRAEQNQSNRSGLARDFRQKRRAARGTLSRRLFLSFPAASFCLLSAIADRHLDLLALLKADLRGDEVRALRELRRQFPDSAFVFAIERGGRFTPDAVNRLVSASACGPASPFRFTLTCSGTPAAMPWRIPDTTRGAFRIGSAIEASSTQRATRN
jgi:hypothetical protein